MSIQKSSFTATSISGCSLWLDANDPSGTGVLPANGATVSTWIDKSSNAYNASGGVSPTYNSSEKAVSFNGSSWLTTSYSSVPTNETSFIVFQTTTTALAASCFMIGPTNNGGRLLLSVNENDGFGLSFKIGSYFVANGSRIVHAQNKVYLGTATVASTTSCVYLNGIQGPNSSLTYSGTGTTQIGTADSGGLPAAFYIGYIYEIIIYNSLLSVAQRQTVEGYLAQKWRLETDLPAFHPGLKSRIYPSLAKNSITNPSLFTPTSISGCSLWLDANDPTTITFSSGSNVSQWRDKSGSNNNHSNASGSVTYSGNTMNFPGNASLVNTSLSGYSFGATSPVTVFVVFSIASVATVPTMFSYGLIQCSQTGFTVYVDTDSYYYGTLYCGALMVKHPVSLNTQYIVSDFTSYAGTSGSFNRSGWINGSPMLLTNVSTTGVNLTNSGGSRVGLSATGQYMNGTVSELIYYNTTLTTAQRQTVEGYLAQKWGLATKLPTFHPGLKSRIYPSLTRNSIMTIPKKGAFTPSSVASCQLWLDASDPTLFSYSSGTTIQQWTDKSGNARNALSNSVVGWAAPTYVAGSPAYVSMQPGQALYVPGFPYTTSWSIFSCMNNVSLGARWYISPYSDLNIVLMGMNQPGNKIYSGILAGDGDITGSHIEYTSAQNTNGTGIYSYFRDGTQISINTTGNSIPSATVRMGIGANGAAAYDIGGTYYPYEILIYNQYLGSNDRQQIEGYLAWKWGLQASLPSGHPYQYSAP